MAIRKIVSRSITDGAVVAGDLSSNSVTNAKIAPGAISGDKLDTNIQFGFKNRIINGDMRIDQRNAGASVTPGGGATYLVDRFSYISTQASKVSAQQVSVTTNGFTKALKFTSLSAYSSVSSDYLFIAQKIEGFNIADLNWGTANAKSITISFVVNSSLTGTFGGALINSAGSMNYVFSYSIPAANTDTTVSVTIPGPTSGTWLTNNGEGLQVRWNLGSGSSYLGTAGSWGATNLMGPTGAVSVAGTNAATWQITGVQLEVGSSATPFDTRAYGTEELLCKRYWTPVGVAYGYAMADGSTMQFTATHPVMRADPSVVMLTSTPYGESPPNVTARNGSGSSAANSEPNKLGQSFIRVTGFSGMTAYQPAKLMTNQVALNAEL